MIYLNTYNPLCKLPKGIEAVHLGEAPFVDGTCRREPDLEHYFPSITSLCRPGESGFVSHLSAGDIVVNLTTKGRYYSNKSHYRLVAILQVIGLCKSHKEAAVWYNKNAPTDRLPYNCMVKQNPMIHPDKSFMSYNEARLHDRVYQTRANSYGKFAITKPVIKIDLKNPPIITEIVLEKIVKVKNLGCTQMRGMKIGSGTLRLLKQRYIKHSSGST